MKKIISIFICLLLFSNVANSTELDKSKVSNVELSFEQAYQLMLENNNSLKAYNEATEVSKFEKRATLGEFSPKLFLNATYIHFSDEMQLHTPVSIPNMGSMITTSTIQEQNLFAAGAGVVWNVFTGGKLLSNHAAARAKLEASNAKYKEIKDDLTLELVKRYYGLSLAREVSDAKKQYMDDVAKHLSDAKKLEKEGVISKSERLHATVAYAQAKKDYQASLRDINIVEEGLKTLIKSDSANLKNVHVDTVSNLFMLNNFSADEEAMRNNALKNNPKLKQLEQKRKVMNAKYHAQTADFMPTISLFATDIFAKSKLSEAVPTASVGGMANWMLFDGFKRENKVLAAKHERKMVDYEIEDAKYNIETLVTKQYQELLKQKENYESTKASIENAKEALRVASLSFKEGYGTSLQVTDAQTMLLKVQTEQLNSIYNFDVTLTDLLKTNGDTNAILNYISTNVKK
ncbi:MAG: TolC family protein [Candidatus Gastranaerophilales bacterium]|nr:TolC family protein [Candidatus Gastranaerophilales bacterium]